MILKINQFNYHILKAELYLSVFLIRRVLMNKDIYLSDESYLAALERHKTMLLSLCETHNHLKNKKTI